MKGTIRILTGMIIVMGAMGGIEHSVNDHIVPSVAVALIGFAIMIWGVQAHKKQYYDDY